VVSGKMINDLFLKTILLINSIVFKKKIVTNYAELNNYKTKKHGKQILYSIPIIRYF